MICNCLLPFKEPKLESCKKIAHLHYCFNEYVQLEIMVGTSTVAPPHNPSATLKSPLCLIHKLTSTDADHVPEVKRRKTPGVTELGNLGREVKMKPDDIRWVPGI